MRSRTYSAARQNVSGSIPARAAAPPTRAATPSAESFDFRAVSVTDQARATPTAFWSVGPRLLTDVTYQTPPPATGTAPTPATPAAPTCATAFTGATFALTGAAGAARTPGAAARLGLDASGNQVVSVNATGAVGYTPTVTITTTGTATASDYEAGLIQNVLSSDRRAIYPTSATVTTAPSTAPPLKDGAPMSSGMGDVDFAENGSGHPNILASFTTSGSAVPLVLPDAPGGPAWVDIMTDPAFHPPWAPGTLTRVIQHDTFRTWVGIRHKPTGCVRTVHHIDWNTNWDLAVTVTPAAFGAAATVAAAFTTNTSPVTTTNGSGAPAYIRGGSVPADGISRTLS